MVPIFDEKVPAMERAASEGRTRVRVLRWLVHRTLNDTEIFLPSLRNILVWRHGRMATMLTEFASSSKGLGWRPIDLLTIHHGNRS